MYNVRVLADSVSPDDVRLTTLEVVFPRFILAEFNTHRRFSRNSASSRAIPTEKLIEQVSLHPFVPEFNKRTKGMGVGDKLTYEEQAQARKLWIAHKDHALSTALLMLDLDKSRVNRLLEPFMWQTVIVSSTEWGNFWALRTAPSAQPEFQQTASLMQAAYLQSEPVRLPPDAWHLPLVTRLEREERPETPWQKVSVGRCARVSYLTHDGKRDLIKDVELHNRLLESGHMSPFEHVARPIGGHEWSGNFLGWHQYRKDVPYEHDFSLVPLTN